MACGFNIKLTRQQSLRDGRVVATLGDAVALIGQLPEFPRLRPGWLLACEAMARAARTADRDDVMWATCELELALAADHLCEIPRMGWSAQGAPEA